MRNLILQAIRFGGIGILNTVVDFAVLNFLMFYFNIFRGTAVGGFAVFSFTAALVHSYFWNKHWAFNVRAHENNARGIIQFLVASVWGGLLLLVILAGAGIKLEYWFYLLVLAVFFAGEAGMWKRFRLSELKAKVSAGGEFLSFVLISIVAALINFLIVKFGTSNLPPQFGLSVELWANLVKAAATAVSLIWNFLGYKFVVFKR